MTGANLTFKMWFPLFVIVSLFGLHSSATFPTNPITRDVCIIGGGSSGTYAAIRLQQLGHTVAVVEKQSRLGGHVNTYQDPETGATFDFGVIIYENITVVSQYFASLNVTLAPHSDAASSQVYANFKTDGKAIRNPESLPWNNQTNVVAALSEYAGILERYPFLSNGYELPTPVPEELLLPWGEFVETHNLSALAYTVHLYAQGLGNILAQTTLYVMKEFSTVLVQILLGEDGLAFVASASNGNQKLYDQALRQLGNDVFLNTTPTAIHRESEGVTIDVYSHTSGESTTIQAKNLLIAIEPTLSNIQGLGLDMTSHENHLLRQFNNSYYWNAVIKAAGVPTNTDFFDTNLHAPYGIPALPALYTFGGAPGTSDLFTSYFGSPHYLSDEEVKLMMLDEMSRVIQANGYNVSQSPEILAFHNHSPFKLTVSSKSIRNGFYSQMNALQGKRNTWWTGAAWQAQDSSQIWNWTETTLLPRMLASL